MTSLYVGAGILAAICVVACGVIIYQFGFARGYDAAVQDHQDHAFEGHL